MNSDKAEIFSQAWAKNGHELVERLKLSIFTPKKLEYVGWQLNLQMAQSSQARLKSPSAVLQLGLNSEDSEKGLNANKCNLNEIKDRQQRHRGRGKEGRPFRGN
ncbi:hypothetical protein fugu_004158 [Takifugu bimaculatus]|uniref:COMM domain-containing protein n=1 Tax=Takifugu bimaculatus TaxID=433685 RepID=A0A4Z2BBX1_9TELE|nr:hypothetical protein fugu_004158 [Takifugu bimaculatus]